MLLVTRITKSQLNYYREEFLQCLKHNSSNSYINQIIVYTDEFKHNISTSKTKVIFKRIITEEIDIIKESKKTWINKIILSNPFVKFNEDLYKIIDKDLETKVYQNSNYTIFSKNSKISNNGDFELEKSHINIKTEKINTTKKEILKLEENKNHQIGNVLIKKSTFDPNKISATEREKKIDVIIVSVNYNDYLLLSLINNRKIFNNITVVTVDSDKLCQNICKNLGVNCIISERIYENGAKFNKGKAINDAINSLENPDLILLLDADIIVKDKIELSELSDDVLYTSDRIIYKNYESFISETEYLEEVDKGFGFFQLFCYNNPVINKYCVFPESSDTAEGSDIEFKDKFLLKRSIGKKIIHLGETRENWKGRTTKKFISNKLLNKLLKENTFNINKYFDKIYCLNLDRRTDRWIKVSEEFKKFNIEVERFSAIDGNDLEFQEPVEDIQKLSSKGLIENKYALACLKSHREIIKDAKLNGYRRVLIFEDDIIFSEDFSKKIRKISNLDWNLIYLGASQFNWSNIEYQSNFYLSKKTLGTFAYCVDCRIFENLLSTLEQEINSIDNSLSIIQEEKYGKCFTFYPNLVISMVDDSDIRGNLVFDEYSTKVKWNKIPDYPKLASKLKPIEKKPILNKKLALENLIELDTLFKKIEVEYWITCGTLLGFFRDGDFISHDKDTDICVNANQFNGFVLEQILKLGFNIKHCFGKIDDGFEISLYKNGIKTDIFLFYKNDDRWYNSVYADFTNDDCLKFDYKYPKFSLTEKSFLGHNFKVPENIESWLIHQYGEDYMIPKKDWLWWKSPKNIVETNNRIQYKETKSDLNSLLNYDKSLLLDEITLLIKSFMRKECVENLLRSIRKFYKNIKIIIVDDSGDVNYNFDYDKNIKTYQIEYDSGLSFGRNFGVSKINTKYFILLDDDFEFTENTDIIKWFDIFIESGFDLLGADVIMDGKKMDYFANLSIKEKKLKYERVTNDKSNRFVKCDMVLNFFLAKTDIIKNHGWDNDLKLAEHTAFFFEHKDKINVGYTQEISINHQKVLEGNYIKFRTRAKNFLNDWMIKKNIEQIINLTGNITKIK